MLLTIWFSSCAQTKTMVKNSYAYWQVRHAGIIAVDESGNPLTKGVDTVYTVYIETNGNATPTIETVWINNAAHAASVITVDEAGIQLGQPTPNAKPATLKASAGNKLWRLEVGEAQQNKQLPPTAKNTNALQAVVIEGTLNNKKFTQTITSMVELPTINGL